MQKFNICSWDDKKENTVGHSLWTRSVFPLLKETLERKDGIKIKKGNHDAKLIKWASQHYIYFPKKQSYSPLLIIWPLDQVEKYVEKLVSLLRLRMQAGCTQYEGDQLLKKHEGGKSQSKNALQNILFPPKYS